MSYLVPISSSPPPLHVAGAGEHSFCRIDTEPLH